MSIQSSIKGFNLESYQVIPSSASVVLSSPGLTNLFSVTESGELASIGIYIAATPSGNPTVTLEIQIDGQTTQTLSLFAASNSLAAAIRAFMSHVTEAADPGVVRNSLQIPIHTRYQTSCRVGINVGVAGSAGTLDVTVIRGKKI